MYVDESVPRGSVDLKLVVVVRASLRSIYGILSNVLQRVECCTLTAGMRTVEDIGRRVEDKDLGALAAMNDHVTQIQGWLRGVAGEMARERVDACSVVSSDTS